LKGFEARIAAFSGTELIEAERPQRKLFEPEGRVFAPAAQRGADGRKSCIGRGTLSIEIPKIEAFAAMLP
jgi:hypothetical protein